MKLKFCECEKEADFQKRNGKTHKMPDEWEGSGGQRFEKYSRDQIYRILNKLACCFPGIVYYGSSLILILFPNSLSNALSSKYSKCQTGTFWGDLS